MLLRERRPSLSAGFRQMLTSRNKHAGAGGAPWTFWRIGHAAEDSTHYTRCLHLLCLPVSISAGGVGGQYKGVNRFRSRGASDPVGQLLRLSWAGRESANGEVALRHERGRVRHTGRDHAGRRVEIEALSARLVQGSGHGDAAPIVGTQADRKTNRDDQALDRRERAVG